MGLGGGSWALKPRLRAPHPAFCTHTIPRHKGQEGPRVPSNGAGLSADTFDLIISSQHYPEAFAKASEILEIKPGEAVVCTSSVVGVKLAKRAGMIAVAVPTHFGEAMYRKAGADFVTRDLIGLPDLLAAE